MGITLGFTDFTNNLYIIKDVKHRPGRDSVPDSFDRYKETVKWANKEMTTQHPRSELAREPGLPSPPMQFILLLPQDREQKMADEEMRYAKEKGYDFSKVTATLFDFVLVRGVYEPVVIGQAPFDRSLPIKANRR